MYECVVCVLLLLARQRQDPSQEKNPCVGGLSVSSVANVCCAQMVNGASAAAVFKEELASRVSIGIHVNLTEGLPVASPARAFVREVFVLMPRATSFSI